MGMSVCEKRINKKKETQNIAENGQIGLYFLGKNH